MPTPRHGSHEDAGQRGHATDSIRDEADGPRRRDDEPSGDGVELRRSVALEGIELHDRRRAGAECAADDGIRGR